MKGFSITFGIGIFLLAYSFFGQLEVFKEPWISYVVLVFCVLLSVSVFLITKTILISVMKLLKVVLVVRERNHQRENEARYKERQWEAAVVSRVRSLPTPVQSVFKSAGCESFVVMGHDLTIIELTELGAVRVIHRAEDGLRIVLTDKGRATVRKHRSSIY